MEVDEIFSHNNVRNTIAIISNLQRERAVSALGNEITSMGLAVLNRKLNSSGASLWNPTTREAEAVGSRPAWTMQ